MEALVTFEDDSMVFHEEVARKTILNEKFSNFKKSIVSVMGPSRTGKSFFLSYLNKEAESEEIRGAFRPGHSRCTAGILISTKPYQLANDQLIFFLDTQGTFDLETDRKVSVWIASFSLHFSDIQIVNLRGNIGGNDLQDLYTFVQFAMTYPGARLSKQLIFLIRDAPQIDQDNIFLENLQMQCSNSVELKEIMDLLRKQFEISVFCLPTVSENIRQASGFVVMEDSVDSAFYQKMNIVKESIESFCRKDYNKLPEDLIDFGHKICAHITTVAPQLRSTVEIIKQVSKAVAVNKSFDFFLNLIKALKAENFPNRKIEIENETIKHLHSFNLKPEDLEEAKATLMQRMNEKLEELKAQWQRDLDEKEEKEAIFDFLRKERTRINKIYEIKELLENGSAESTVEEFSKTFSKELTRERQQELSQKVTNMVTDRLSYLKEYNLPRILDKYRVIHRDKLENHFILFDKLPASHVLESIKLETEDELKAELRSLQFKIDEETLVLQKFEEILQTSTSTFLQHKQTILDQRNHFENLKRQQVEVFDNGGEESWSFDAANRSPSNESLYSDMEWTPNASPPEFSDRRHTQDKPNSTLTQTYSNPPSNSRKPMTSNSVNSRVDYGTINQPIINHSTRPNPRKPTFTQDSDQETKQLENTDSKSMIEKKLVHQEAIFREFLARTSCFDRDILMKGKTRSLLAFAEYLQLQEPVNGHREFYAEILDVKIEALIAQHLARNASTSSFLSNQQVTRPQKAKHLEEGLEIFTCMLLLSMFLERITRWLDSIKKN